MRFIALLIVVLLTWCASPSAGEIELLAPNGDGEALAGYTLVDWHNRCALVVDGFSQLHLNPFCNLSGGLTLGFPAPDTCCNPEAVYEPEFELTVSGYWQYMLPGGTWLEDLEAEIEFWPELEGAPRDTDLLDAGLITSQEQLDALQVASWARQAIEPEGQARVCLLSGGELAVPYFQLEAPDSGEMPYYLEYAVLHESASGPVVITVSLNSLAELDEELVQLATTRLRLLPVDPPQPE